MPKPRSTISLMKCVSFDSSARAGRICTRLKKSSVARRIEAPRSNRIRRSPSISATFNALGTRFRVIKYALDVFECDLAGGRQAHAAFGANKKRLAEFGFERLDLMTDRRLGQMQALGRARKV